MKDSRFEIQPTRGISGFCESACERKKRKKGRASRCFSPRVTQSIRRLVNRESRRFWRNRRSYTLLSSRLTVRFQRTRDLRSEGKQLRFEFRPSAVSAEHWETSRQRMCRRSTWWSNPGRCHSGDGRVTNGMRETSHVNVVRRWTFLSARRIILDRHGARESQVRTTFTYTHPELADGNFWEFEKFVVDEHARASKLSLPPTFRSTLFPLDIKIAPNRFVDVQILIVRPTCSRSLVLQFIYSQQSSDWNEDEPYRRKQRFHWHRYRFLRCTWCTFLNKQVQSILLRRAVWFIRLCFVMLFLYWYVASISLHKHLFITITSEVSAFTGNQEMCLLSFLKVQKLESL